MAVSTIHTKNDISNPILRFTAGSGPEPTSADLYPRYEIRNAGVRGSSRELCMLYKPDSNTTYYNSLMDQQGHPAFGRIGLSWSNTVTIAPNSDRVAISASVPYGCRFICWIGAASRGNVTTSNIEFMDLPNTTLWVENKVNYSRDFVGYFLYAWGLDAHLYD